jgi:hypothetical protein
VSRDVIFDETVYPFSKDQSSPHPTPTEDAILLSEPETDDPLCNDTAGATDSAFSHDVSGSADPSTHDDRQMHMLHAPPHVDLPPAAGHGAAPDEPGNGTPDADSSPPRTPSATAHEPAQDAHGPASSPSSVQTADSSATSTDTASPALPARRPIKPVRLFDGIIRYDSKKRAFAAEPTSHVDALSVPAWKTAMDAEFSALKINNTWRLVDPPPGRHIVGCKWVFKLKHKPDGTVVTRLGSSPKVSRSAKALIILIHFLRWLNLPLFG